MPRVKSIACLLFVFMAATAHGDDWPQWRGPNRADISHEKGLMKEWPEGGPKLLWVYKDAGAGYSGVSVVGDTMYTMATRDDNECLVALNVKDGTEKWITKLGPRIDNNWGDGPRDTPTVDGDLVYCLSAPGVILCANAKDGTAVWTKSMQDFGGKVPTWGYTESVLIDGDKLVCTPGGPQGAIVALNKKTGELLWQTKDLTEDAHYSSIIAADYEGKHQYIQLLVDKIVGIDSADGSVLWKADWGGRTAVIPTPIFHDGFVFVSSGYDAGCKLIHIEGDHAEKVYENKTMKNHHGGVVLVGDYLYGYSDGVGWLCQEFKTGKLVWNNKDGLGKGCLSCADGQLYLLGEGDGQVKLIDASPDGWKEHGSFKLEAQTTKRRPAGRIWTHPVVANGRMYLRDQELISCFDVKAP